MDVMERFLQSEINSQELYDEIIMFITSFHIRSGELEGNEYIIKKMDQENYILFSEYGTENNAREIHVAIAVYRDNLIKAINECAKAKGIKTIIIE